MVSLKRELETAKIVAVEAGKILLSHYDTDYKVDLKAGAEPVTIADKTSSQHIVDVIRRAFPHDAIVSEESELPSGLAQAERIWLIDPMDGTHDFINHNGEFAVMIGLVREGDPVMGVVYQPVTDTMCWASHLEGSFYQGQQGVQQLQVSTEANLNKLRVAASRSNYNRELGKLYRRLGFQHIVRSGSLGLKFSLIARQACDIYFNMSNITACWDTCAPEVILKEAGGRISNLSGTRLTYTISHVKNRNGVIATNGPIHDYLVEQIQQVLSQRVQEQLASS